MIGCEILKKVKEIFAVAFGLILLSGVLYYIHYRVFGQFKDTMYYTFLDISFIPINILIVTLVFDNILERRDRIRIMDKLNMIVGLFFNEMGCKLMNVIIQGDDTAKGVIEDLDDLRQVEKKIKQHEHKLDIYKIDIEELETILSKNKSLIISFISNENILEHQSFSELLMAVAHLADEIGFRKSSGINKEDLEHLQDDVIRVYKSITIQWVGYLKHIKIKYPYLYKAAIKFNPFE